jgi:tetratricopeptide (TPR) repeat protein
MYQQNGMYEEAIKWYLEDVVICDQLGNKADIDTLYRNIADVYETIGKYQEAKEYLEKALILSREMENLKQVAITTNNIGSLLYELQEFQEAIDYYKAAMDINQELGEAAALANNYQNTGTAYRQMGDHSEAKKMFEKAMEINKSLGAMSNVAWTMGSLARSQEMQEKLEMAIETRMRAAQIYADMGDHESHVNQLSSAGDLHERLGNPAAAKECYKKIVEVYETINNAEEAEKWRRKIK